MIGVMMTVFRIGVAVFLISLIAVAVLLGQPGYRSELVYDRPKPPVAQPTAAVARLVAALSNDSLEARRTARRELLAMGPQIRPQLQWTLDAERGTMPGVDFLQAGLRYAIVELTVVIDHLDEQRQSAGSTITMHFANAPFVEILRSFGSQIDSRVSVSSRPDPRDLDWLPPSRATLDLDGVNYWDALRAIRQNLGLNPTFGPNAVEFSRRAGLRTPDFPLDAANAIVAGPLLIAQASLERQQSGILLTLQAVAEPKIGAGQYGEYGMVRLNEVTDDRGQSLLSAGTHPTFTSVSTYHSQRAPAEFWGWKVPVQLPLPTTGRRIGAIRGEFGVAIGPPGMDIVIADLARGGNHVFEWDGVVVTVASVRQAGTQYVVAGNLSAPSGSPMGKAMAEKDSTGWALENAQNRINRLGLMEAFGKYIRREMALSQVRREADRDVIGWTLTTVDLARLSANQLRQPESCAAQCIPASLTWSVPVETRWFMVPFELRGVAEPAGNGAGNR